MGEERERMIHGKRHWRTKEGTWRPYTTEEKAERERRGNEEYERSLMASFRDDDK